MSDITSPLALDETLARIADVMEENGKHKRRIRKNVNSILSNLPTAIAEQNLEKYGYIIGDWFDGPSGYRYFLADRDSYYGGYNSYAVLGTHHLGLVVETFQNVQWNTTNTTATGYKGSNINTYMNTTVLDNIKADMKALFGGSTGLEHLLSHQKLYTTALDGWAWEAAQYISALSEIQVYSSTVWSANGFQEGENARPLEIFLLYRFNEILGNIWFWLRNIKDASYACGAFYTGNAINGTASDSGGAVALILFY